MLFIFFAFLLSCENPTADDDSELGVYTIGECLDWFYDYYSDYDIEESQYEEGVNTFYCMSAYTIDGHVLKSEWIIINVGINSWKTYSYYFNQYR